MFAAVNMLSVYLLLFPVAPLTPAAIVVAYVLLAVVQDGCLRRGRSTLLPFTVPIVALAIVKAIPGRRRSVARIAGTTAASADDLGADRHQLFCVPHELSGVGGPNGVASLPTSWQYLGFCFFPLTMAVGPIKSPVLWP
jgi:hypothetical protein